MTNWGQSRPAHAVAPRRRIRVLAGLAVAGALTLAACTATVDGHDTGPTPAAPTSASTSGGPTSSSTSPDFTGQPTSATPSGTVTAGALSALLMPAPSGSSGGSSTWARTLYPTPTQFATRYYPPGNVSAVVDDLQEEGLTHIAHRLWIARNGTQADVLLFSFSGDTGAQTRYATATTAQSKNTGVKAITLPKLAHPARGYRGPADSDGYVTGIAYSVSGPVVAEIFTYTPKRKFDSASTQSWAKTQISRLP